MVLIEAILVSFILFWRVSYCFRQETHEIGRFLLSQPSCDPVNSSETLNRSMAGFGGEYFGSLDASVAWAPLSRFKLKDSELPNKVSVVSSKNANRKLAEIQSAQYSCKFPLLYYDTLIMIRTAADVLANSSCFTVNTHVRSDVCLKECAIYYYEGGLLAGIKQERLTPNDLLRYIHSWWYSASVQYNATMSYIENVDPIMIEVVKTAEETKFYYYDMWLDSCPLVRSDSLSPMFRKAFDVHNELEYRKILSLNLEEVICGSISAQIQLRMMELVTLFPDDAQIFFSQLYYVVEEVFKHGLFEKKQPSNADYAKVDLAYSKIPYCPHEFL